MTNKTVIPAIDLKGGKVVRLQQGDYSKETIFADEPLKVIKEFIKYGSDRLHIINLDGAKSGEFRKSKNYSAIRKIIRLCNKVDMKIQLGGGLRDSDLITELIEQGVDKVILGTMAFEKTTQFEQLLEEYRENIIVSLDVKDNTLRTRGWLKDTDISLKEALARFRRQGVGIFIITDIAKDGMGVGFNVDLYKSIDNDDIELIAAGGISSIKDVNTALKYCDGVVIGKALYDGSINRNNLKKAIDQFNNHSTLIKRIVPCLDVKEGRVVKGIKFKNLRDAGDPVELARYYNDQGADELIFLDISATLEGRKSMLDVIKMVAENVFIPFGVGGGIKSLEDMKHIINAGAEKISINSAAVQHPELITQGAHKFGSQAIMVAIDAKRVGTNWEVYTHAGSVATGLDTIQWARQVETLGAGELLVTSMDQDGTQQGYDLELLEKICSVVNIPVIASGGAGSYEHFLEAIKVGSEAVLAASLFHYNEMRIKKLKHYLKKENIAVRLT